MEIKISETNISLSLHPDHLADLRKSGLSDETIQEAGIYSVPPMDIKRKLGQSFPYLNKIESLMAIPYPGTNGYERFKLFPSLPDRKYHQNGGNRLYIPSSISSSLSDPSIPFYVTEGEKKALKTTQEGLYCLGPGGLWNWSDGTEEKNLIPDFDLIEWKGRAVYIIPDNDWLNPNRHGERRNLREAVYGLAYRLIDRGAKVFIMELPSGELKGLDDYLCNHTAEEFLKLPRHKVRKLTIEEEINEVSGESLKTLLKRIANTSLTETQVEFYIDAIHKKLGLSKSSIKKDIKNLKATDKDKVSLDRLLESEDEPEERWSAQVYRDNILSFGAFVGGEPVHIGSDGEAVILKKDAVKFRKTKLTREAIKRFKSGEDVNGHDLIESLKGLLSDHIIFKDKRLPLLLSVWIVGTYLFKIFHFYGYLFINSPVKRCGKSLLLDIFATVCFNSTSRLLNPSESSTFRTVDGNDASLIIDEIESLSNKDKEKRPEMVALLNAGFQRGAEVSRTETKNKEFVVNYFNAYSPKVLAGIRSIADTIEDRCFKITMMRKIRGETIRRFNLRILKPHIDRIRDDLFIWALRYALDVAEVYEGIKEVPGTEGFDDRLRDILEPLLSVASVIDVQANDNTMPTVRGLIAIVKDMVKGREATENLNNAVPVAVSIMKKMLDGVDERFVSVEELFEKFKSEDDLAFIQSKRGMAFFLSKLDINRMIPKKIDGTTTRGYILKEDHLADLERRYS